MLTLFIVSDKIITLNIIISVGLLQKSHRMIKKGTGFLICRNLNGFTAQELSENYAAYVPELQTISISILP